MADSGSARGATDAGSLEPVADAGGEEATPDVGGVEPATDAGRAEPDAARPAPPTIESFTASPQAIASGGPSQLLAVFSNGVGSVSGVGTVTSGVATTVRPSATTTYVLTVAGNDGTSLQQSATVTISDSCLSGEVGGQHWTAAKSPYCISGNLSVASGTRLVIDPGVQVIFQGRFHVDVMGALTAQGTPSQMIVFTAADTVAGWGGLRFWNGNGHKVDDVDQWIEYAELSFGKVGGPDTPGAYYNLRGGCVYAVDLADGKKFHFNNNFVHHCSATYKQLPSHGGAFFWGGSHFLKMVGNVWEDNYAIGEGGAVGVVHSVGVRIEGGSFNRNRAGSRGGAARIFDGDITVDGALLGAGTEANAPDDFTAGVNYVPPD